ncbi:hypothetical protein TRIP_C20044 [Candidatus Zixiibacteriota bacterium]|nr:hypothetical protein TRIP_C20044 [candidate division Zixibacteria bacterium]
MSMYIYKFDCEGLDESHLAVS